MPEFKKVRFSGAEFEFRDVSKIPLPKQNSNGASDQILRSNGDGTTRWDYAATQEEIGSAVESWLEENVASGETLIVDNSLAISGAAADAKVTGDNVRELTSAISAMHTANTADEGDALKAKTIENGVVTEWEFGPVGNPTDNALSVTSINPVQNKVIAGALGAYTALSDYGNNITEILEWIIDAVENPIDPNAVDVCLFAGQSNMDGRGRAADATPITTGKAYRWDNANNVIVDFAPEGSLIPAFMQEYTRLARVPLVAVKVAEGGMTISNYINSLLPTAKTRIENCITYINNSGKTVRRVFMLWCQGESDVDGDASTGTQAYEAYFSTLRDGVMASGVEKIFIINIGQANSGTFDFAPIRTALQNVCNDVDTFMVCDKFLNATRHMDTRWHYDQIVYNVVGKFSAENVIGVYKNGAITNPLIPFNAADIYGVPDTYGNLSDFNHALFGEDVVLNEYIGESTDVTVYRFYKDNDMYYRAGICRLGAHLPFKGNTQITSVTFEDGVLYAHSNGSMGADQQLAGYLFDGCTSLVSVANIPPALGYTHLCNNTLSLTHIDGMPELGGLLDYAFSRTGLTSFGDIIGGITNLTRCFEAAVNLQTVGDIDISTLSGVDGSTMFKNCRSLEIVGNISGLSSMTQMFRYCDNLKTIGTISGDYLTDMSYTFGHCNALQGILRIESPNVSNATGMLGEISDLSKIKIQVPAGSTTYNTIIAAYPNADIETFTLET